MRKNATGGAREAGGVVRRSNDTGEADEVDTQRDVRKLPADNYGATHQDPKERATNGNPS